MAASSATTASSSSSRPQRDDDVQPPSAVRPTVVTAVATATGAQTFVTASGRTLELDADAIIPTAGKKKRPLVRATTAVLAVGALMAVVILAILLLVWVLKEKSSVDPITGHQRIGYDAGEDPLQAGTGFLFWSLDEPTVILLDAAGLNRAWLNEMKDVIVDASDRSAKAGNTPLQVAALTDLGIRFYPDKLRVLKSDDVGKVRSFLAPIPAMSFPDPVAGMEAAVKTAPRRIILVTGQQLTDRQIDDIDLLLDHHPDVRLSAALLSVHLPRLHTLVNKTGGKYVSMPQEDFLGWHAKAHQAEVTEPATP